MRYEKPEPGKPILIEIGDRLVEVKFTLKALKELDVEHGLSIMGGMGQAFMDPAKLAVMLYYGLRTKQPDITQEWVEDNVDASMLLDLAPVLAYATTGRFPDVDKILEAQGQSPNAAGLGQIGSPSGPSDATTLASANANSGS